MKNLLLFLFFINLNITYSQSGHGGLQVSGYKNSTGKLKDNIQLHEINVKVIGKGNNLDTLISYPPFYTRVFLPPGNYDLICYAEGEEDVYLKNVLIASDKIQFIELLYEPITKLNSFERRKRAKTYRNKRYE